MMAVWRCDWPLILVRCRPSRTLPGFVVRVVRTSGPEPPMLIRPTDDSGFACVLYWKMRLAQSVCASQREGT